MSQHTNTKDLTPFIKFNEEGLQLLGASEPFALQGSANGAPDEHGNLQCPPGFASRDHFILARVPGGDSKGRQLLGFQQARTPRSDGRAQFE